MAVVKVVKYNGGPDVLAWKYPSEALGTWSQLIVNESQAAVLYKGGAAMDVFPPGRHTLSTENIPFLNKIVNMPFGGKSPFTAEIWYINKVHALDIKWGTQAPIQLQDPKYKVFLPLRAFGQFGVQVQDPKQFLTKLVGTLPVFNTEYISDFFRGVYLTKAKDSISSYLIKEGISALEINAYLVDLSEHICERVSPTFEEYGINLINFFVKSINVPEEDPSVQKLKDALSKKAEMNIIGYNYTQERSFDTLEGAAKNPGSAQSGLMGAGIGLGIGAGIGGAFGDNASGLTSVINIKNTRPCTSCGTEIDADARFCPKCGQTAEKSTPCPKCGVLIEGDMRKFCPDCGQLLAKTCKNCDAQIEGDPRFCPDCGNNLQEGE